MAPPALIGRGSSTHHMAPGEMNHISFSMILVLIGVIVFFYTIMNACSTMKYHTWICYFASSHCISLFLGVAASTPATRHSGDVPEFGVLVAKVSYLSFVQPFEPVIPPSFISDLVLAHVVDDAETGHEEDNNLSSEINAVADGVSRRIANEVCPSAKH